jgi:tetratricopeptide (TPR) repeat protein
MHKNNNAPKLNPRFAQTAARTIVRAWPAETREWGQAFAAELPAAETAGATATWLIGGVMLLVRAWLKHAWRALGRPIGANASETNSAFTPRYSRTPRTPLWLMLTLTTASIAILLHPEVRQSLTFLRSAYTHHDWQPENWSSVQTLREISKSNRDAHLLALLSLLSTDIEKRSRLAQEAIQKDPSLTWLDYDQSLNPSFDVRNRINLSKDRVDRLQKWDPDNSIPHILAAEIVAEAVRLEEYDSVMHGKRPPNEQKALAANSGWLARMESAFSAPKYDSYTAQSTELVRTIAKQFAVRDPRIAEHILSRKRVPQFLWLDDYIDRGGAFEKSGNTQEALAAYSEALRFAQRINFSAETPDEQYFAERMGVTAGEKLAPLYASLGRSDEAAMVSLQMAQWKAEHDPRIFRYIPLRYHRAEFKALTWSGLLINLTGLSLLFILPLALISVLFVFSRRKTAPSQRGFTDFCASLFARRRPVAPPRVKPSPLFRLSSLRANLPRIPRRRPRRSKPAILHVRDDGPLRHPRQFRFPPRRRLAVVRPHRRPLPPPRSLPLPLSLPPPLPTTRLIHLTACYTATLYPRSFPRSRGLDPTSPIRGDCPPNPSAACLFLFNLQLSTVNLFLPHGTRDTEHRPRLFPPRSILTSCSISTAANNSTPLTTTTSSPLSQHAPLFASSNLTLKTPSPFSFAHKTFVNACNASWAHQIPPPSGSISATSHKKSATASPDQNSSNPSPTTKTPSTISRIATRK